MSHEMGRAASSAIDAFLKNTPRPFVRMFEDIKAGGLLVRQDFDEARRYTSALRKAALVPVHTSDEENVSPDLLLQKTLYMTSANSLDLAQPNTTSFFDYSEYTPVAHCTFAAEEVVFDMRRAFPFTFSSSSIESVCDALSIKTSFYETPAFVNSLNIGLAMSRQLGVSMQEKQQKTQKIVIPNNYGLLSGTAELCEIDPYCPKDFLWAWRMRSGEIKHMSRPSLFIDSLNPPVVLKIHSFVPVNRMSAEQKKLGRIFEQGIYHNQVSKSAIACLWYNYISAAHLSKSDDVKQAAAITDHVMGTILTSQEWKAAISSPKAPGLN